MLEKEYCVAIRTLGTAGEKYQQLLDSIQTQTFSPRKILVYIPYGYPTPKETIGIEQIIRCEKAINRGELVCNVKNQKYMAALYKELQRLGGAA